MLKFKVAKIEDVPENLRSLYTQGTDNFYYLNVDGAVSRDRLDEFRNNNIALSQQLERFKGIDPEKVAEILENERKIEEKKLIDAGDIDGLVASRVAAMKQEHEQVLTGLRGQLDVSNRQLETLLIDNLVRESATKLGVSPSAVDDVLLRVKNVFKVENGKPVARDGQGNIIYGADGQNSLEIGTWVGSLKDKAPHLFGSSSGSGSNNNPRTPTNPNGKPMSAAQKISAGLQAGSQILS